MAVYSIGNKVDFYITNVCNLTCQHCNRFNNFDFRGWQRWQDYEPVYREWAHFVDLPAVTIMGGEPFLNSTLSDWITGINRLFGIEVQILTNGTRFRQSRHVYDALHYESPRTRLKNHIAVSLHNPEELDRLIDDIHAFLGPGVKMHQGRQAAWNSDYHFVDQRGIIIRVHQSTDFMTSSVIQDLETGRFRLHDNDPEIAHTNCAFVKWKSYHFIRGALYKCGPVALMPEFDQQHEFDISPEDRVLLNSYRPLTVENFYTHHQAFFRDIDNVLPQCKFCSVDHRMYPILPVRKKARS